MQIKQKSLLIGNLESAPKLNFKATKIDKTLIIVSEMKALHKDFRASCNGVLDQKKISKDYFFQMLNYNTMFSKRAQWIDDAIESCQFSRAKEAFSKFSWRGRMGVKHASW